MIASASPGPSELGQRRRVNNNGRRGRRRSGDLLAPVVEPTHQIGGAADQQRRSQRHHQRGLALAAVLRIVPESPYRPEDRSNDERRNARHQGIRNQAQDQTLEGLKALDFGFR